MKKLNELDKTLRVVGGFLAAFIIATMVIYTIKDWQFDALIQGVVGVGGIESIAMALIQIGKYIKSLKKKDESEVDDDES